MPKRSKKEAEGGAAGETGAPPKPARKKKATEEEEGALPKPARKKKATEEEEGAPPKPARKKKTKTEEEEGTAPGPGGKKAGEAEGDAEEEEEEKGGDEEGGGAAYRDPPTRETTPCGRRFTLKVTSWNVDGLRAWVRKGGLQWVQEEAPDVLCLQETKCGGGAVPPEVRALPRLPHQYWASASQRPGYSGVGLLARLPPLAVTYGIGDEEHDAEGRVVTAEFPGLFVVAAYVPNAGRGLTRLAYRQRWDAAFRAYLAGLDARKPVALCGDLNVAHEPIDLRHPGPNRRSPGFTPQERAAFGELLAAGFFDSFRHLYPALRHAYTFWTYLGGARRRNVGWRLDYFVLSRRLEGALCDSKIRSHVPGSDHCPITLLLAL